MINSFPEKKAQYWFCGLETAVFPHGPAQQTSAARLAFLASRTVVYREGDSTPLRGTSK